jgi:prophage antirepressor-like protein
MSNLTQFAFQDNQVRVLMLDNNPWFVALDVCKILGITNNRDALTRLKEYEKGNVAIADAIGRNQDTAIISEPGLYRLILTSRKPEAEPFQDWVCQEVLPQIRKTGSYQVKPKSEIELLIESAQHLLKLQQEQERIKLEQQLQSQKMAELESLTHQHDSEIDRIFNPNGHYFSIMGYYNNHKLGAISLVEAAAIGKKVTAYCKSKGILITPMNDPRFGRVNTYPEDAISMFVN